MYKYKLHIYNDRYFHKFLLRQNVAKKQNLFDFLVWGSGGCSNKFFSTQPANVEVQDTEIRSVHTGWEGKSEGKGRGNYRAAVEQLKSKLNNENCEWATKHSNSFLREFTTITRK